MSGFSADWLRLREPFDHHARQAALKSLALNAQIDRWRAENGTAALSVIDLACGSGSTLRALAPQLGGAQHWRLLDHDPALLAAAPDALAAWAHSQGYRHVMQAQGAQGLGHIEIVGPDFNAHVTLEQMDLVHDLHHLDLAHTHLVTGSALLDLVSSSWLGKLVRQARDAHAAMLFALNVNGQTAWTPTDPHDLTIHTLFASHQLRDKGFGPALAGQAAPLALRLMKEAGYAVTQAPSDWVIDAQVTHADPAFDVHAMLAAMIDGMAAAALEQAQASHSSAGASPDQVIALWRARRHAALLSTRLQVGHIDLCATLP